MAHIHTEPHQYDLTASAFIVRLDTVQPSLLLHKHKKLHMYLQFGGHVELHENPWGAVTHEISEESGYTIDQLKLLQPNHPTVTVSSGVIHPVPAVTLSVQYGTTDHYHTDIAYAFVAHQAPTGTLSDDESHDIAAFTAAELAALPAGQIPENVREIGLYVLNECLANWNEVDCAAFLSKNPTFAKSEP